MVAIAPAVYPEAATFAVAVGRVGGTGGLPLAPFASNAPFAPFILESAGLTASAVSIAPAFPLDVSSTRPAPRLVPFFDRRRHLDSVVGRVGDLDGIPHIPFCAKRCRLSGQSAGLATLAYSVAPGFPFDAASSF